MSVHRIHPHVINNDNHRNNNDTDIFNNLNNLFNTNNNKRTTSNFNANGQQINSIQFRGIIKLIIHILKGFLRVSRLSDQTDQNHSQRQNVFKRIANHFKK